MNIGLLDVDTYQLPVTRQGEKIRISFSPKIYTDYMAPRAAEPEPSAAVFDEQGRPIHDDPTAVSNGEGVTFKPKADRKYYMSLIGDHKRTRYDRLEMTVRIVR